MNSSPGSIRSVEYRPRCCRTLVTDSEGAPFDLGAASALDLSDALLLELIDHSYDLVRASLTKKLQAELAELEAAQGS